MTESAPLSNGKVAAESFSKVAFDYLVIGGGSTGLPVAVRLSEDPGVTVGLIEAGLFHQGESLIDIPGHVAKSRGNPKYDWNFSTTPQSSANGRSIPVPRGKMLGGSSGLNYLAWDRASKAEYDAWKTLSDADGWTWEDLFPYFIKCENAASNNQDPYPSFSQSKDHVVNCDIQESHGRSGPVKISYNSEYTDVIPHCVRGWNALGIMTNANPHGGNKAGVYNAMRAVDPETGTRSDAAKAYFSPVVQKRQNLHTLTNARATKIVFDEHADSHGNLVATGVQFDVDGTVFFAAASKEVVVSAGVIQTPQLLELSGIGDGKRLRDLGIKPLVDLPGVGENLQDHIFVGIQYAVKPGIRTFDELRINPSFKSEQLARYEATKDGWLAANDNIVVFLPLSSCGDSAKFPAKLQLLEELIKNDDLNPLQKAQYEIQIAWLKGGEVPNMEICLFNRGVITPQPNKCYFFVLAGIQHPFSRGSVHINSADPLAAPKIDPRYLSQRFDLDMLIDGYRLLERFSETEPMKNIIDSRSFPENPFNNDEDLSAYIRAGFSSGSHQIGTCAMARRELGGVVDSHLKVHGTTNLRIADTSIIPIPIAAHTQATAFAIGEKAASLIKRDMIAK